METTYGDIRFSGVAKGLLGKLSIKELTLKEFLRECAYWALREGFDELRTLPNPTLPSTAAFTEFENLPPLKRLQIEQKFFEVNPEVMEYYKRKFWVYWHNYSNLQYLKEIRNYLPEGELLIAKIDAMILDHIAFFNDPTIAKLKDHFDARESEKG